MENTRGARSKVLLSLCLLVAGMLIVSAIHPVRGAGTLYINPPRQGPFAPGTIVTYEVRVASMDTFGGWAILVNVTEPSLTPQSVSIQGNIFEANGIPPASIFEAVNCVNDGYDASGHPIPTGQPGDNGCDITQGDGPGMVHSVVGAKLISGSGLLFTITYVAGGGNLTSVSFYNDRIENGTRAGVPHTTSGGIYGNAKPLKVDFSWKPPNPFVGDPVTLDGSNSSDPNSNAKIVSYKWVFGDGAVPVTVYSNATETHVFVDPTGRPLAGTYPVTLIVTDSLSLSGQTSHRVTVAVRGSHDLAVTEISLSGGDSIPLGKIVTIDVHVTNEGTFTETSFNLTASVEGQLLGARQFQGIFLQGRDKTYSFTWNTTGLQPGAYEIDAAVPPLRNATSSSHEIIESNIQNDMLAHFVVLVPALQGSLIPFTMPESLGLVVAGLVGLGLARMGRRRVRARKGRLSEGLV